MSKKFGRCEPDLINVADAVFIFHFSEGIGLFSNVGLERDLATPADLAWLIKDKKACSLILICSVTFDDHQ